MIVLEHSEVAGVEEHHLQVIFFDMCVLNELGISDYELYLEGRCLFYKPDFDVINVEYVV